MLKVYPNDSAPLVPQNLATSEIHPFPDDERLLEAAVGSAEGLTYE